MNSIQPQSKDLIQPPLDHRDQLKQKWRDLKEAQAGVRIRDAAKQLSVTEEQLLLTRLGDGVQRLRCEPGSLFEAMGSLGKVMALTRNEWAVIEKTGQYNNVEIFGTMGIVLDPQIDLRLFLAHYHSIYAVEVPSKGEKVLHSIQFFDPCGVALHKVYVKSKRAKPAYDRLVERFLHQDQSWSPSPPQASDAVSELPDEKIDQEAFKQAWLDLKDTHEFFGMLRKYEVTRTQALRLAPEGMTMCVDPQKGVELLHAASEQGVSIMVFVGSKGCIEIHTGVIKKVAGMGSWINVLDPGFNLHLNMEGVTDAWVVRKPTTDGIVTSLELFDDKGEVVVMFFGERKPGVPELESWRALLGEVVQ